MTLPIVAQFARLGIVREANERRSAQEYVERLHIILRQVGQPAGKLSGGNQQKVVLSKWLMTKPRIIILDEPTCGIDVGAKAEVHRLMGALAAEGIAILMISSELPEVLAMSDRVLVVREGRLVAQLDKEEATAESVMTAATGHTPCGRRAGHYCSRFRAEVDRGGLVHGDRCTQCSTSPQPHGRNPAQARNGDIAAACVGGARHHGHQPRYLNSNSVRSILLWVPLLTIIGMGQMMVIIIRGIDVSVGSMVGLAGLVVGLIFVTCPAFRFGRAYSSALG